MSSLAVGFAARMRKHAARAKEETTPSSEGLDEKHFKQFGPAAGVHISSAAIFVASLKRAPYVLSALESDAQGVSWEACELLEDGALAEGPPLDGGVANEALPIEEVGGLPPQANRHSLTLYGARRTRPPDKMILNSYVKPLEWNHPLADVSTPDKEVAQLLIKNCNPFYKRDSSVAHMHDL